MTMSPGPLPMLSLVSAILLQGAMPAPSGPDELRRDIEGLRLADSGIRLGVQVVMDGRGEIFGWEPGVPRAAASAIKTAVAVDLLATRSGYLDDVPQGIESLLQPGVHPAMAGFTYEELSRCRRDLAGKTYRDLARIMMGRTPAANEVYNAACNLIMIKLGGPGAITGRLHALDASFRGIEIDRYMQRWNADGDNQATPEALAALYGMTASGHVPGLEAAQVQILREWLLAADGQGTEVYEKEGTLFPSPMVRVRAGYVPRAGGWIVYAVMGEIPDAGSAPSPDLFLRLMNSVDTLASRCRMLSAPPRR